MLCRRSLLISLHKRLLASVSKSKHDVIHFVRSKRLPTPLSTQHCGRATKSARTALRSSGLNLQSPTLASNLGYLLYLRNLRQVHACSAIAAPLKIFAVLQPDCTNESVVRKPGQECQNSKYVLLVGGMDGSVGDALHALLPASQIARRWREWPRRWWQRWWRGPELWWW